jgi:hypothetical protein
LRILVLTSRDIDGNSGEASLMCAKEAALRKQGCTVAYAVCRFRNPDMSSSVDALYRFSTWQWLINPIGSYRRLKSVTETWKPDALVLSGHWLKFHPWIIGKLKRQNPIVISLDLQGALEEFTEYNLVKGNRLLSWLFYKLLAFHERRLMKHVDVVEVVSPNFEAYVRGKYPWFRGQIVVVPCGVTSVLDDDSYNRYRSTWRNRLGIADDEVVAVYAGGLSRWQRVGDITAFARTRPSLRVFLLTNGDATRVGEQIPDNVSIRSLLPNEVLEALCAFDYGFLLRNDDMTNHVAFPNKASEYLNARLQILVDSLRVGCIWPAFAHAFIPLANFEFEYQVQPKTTSYPIAQLLYDCTTKKLHRSYLAAGRSDVRS